MSSTAAGAKSHFATDGVQRDWGAFIQLTAYEKRMPFWLTRIARILLERDDVERANMRRVDARVNQGTDLLVTAIAMERLESASPPRADTHSVRIEGTTYPIVSSAHT